MSADAPVPVRVPATDEAVTCRYREALNRNAFTTSEKAGDGWRLLG
jgi:hypothetical protein